MAKQSRLDFEGVEYRANRIPGKNRYEIETNPYDENNEDAKAHDDSPWGKGTGKDMTFAVRDLTAPKSKMNYSTLDTSEEAGGMYDKYGAKGVNKAFQGDAGREWAKTINIYSKNEEYGPNSVDVDTTVKGQFIVK